MTVVIGVLANRQRAADPKDPGCGTLILCADTMATYAANGEIVASAQTHGKIYPLAGGFCAAFCDDYSCSHQILCGLNRRLGELDFADPCIRMMVKAEVQGSFTEAYGWMREEALREIGLTLDEFLHDKSLNPSLYAAAEEQLQRKFDSIPSEFILAGQTCMGPVFMKASVRGIEESTEYLVSGGPQESALNWLKMRMQHSELSVPRSFFHMMEAKWFAEQDPSVGPATQAVILWSHGRTDVLSARAHLLETWQAEFGLKATTVLDSDERMVSLETNYTISRHPTPSTSRT